jgi:hypothetical protein
MIQQRRSDQHHSISARDNKQSGTVFQASFDWEIRALAQNSADLLRASLATQSDAAIHSTEA